ncbi:alpha/beta hydrolase [Flagellimonas sediminis]|uniref:Alpha/beta hydrolase fold domain-containing protein n=1 Tax=Flagellimonas sediminis TaxID=2696468 RepID=A0A6I5KNZ7_9FLAO|nr:alpha/beta hydrolase [Allomuricauda sediminis]NDV42604.1 alpha/beta hydrolase fold domain-containing protein [Allomuricauda sediminis]
MKSFKRYTFLIMLVTMEISAQHTIMPLWPKEIPNQKETDEKEDATFNDDGILWITNVQEPTIEVYLPNKRAASGQAVVIFPGGGYYGLAYDWEGTDIAKTFNAKGIAGIVVKYRLPWSKSITSNKNIVPLQDAQRAIRMVRQKAGEWNISPNKIGIMGFSAGGHLASTLGTHYNENVYDRQDDIDDLSARPDFMALVYPVITLGAVSTHSGSRKSLVGENPTGAQIDYLSNEKHVDKDAPPTFLIHAADDGSVSVENSILFFRALRENGVSSALHVYPHGGHGFSLALHDPVLRDWINVFFDWVEHLD